MMATRPDYAGLHRVMICHAERTAEWYGWARASRCTVESGARTAHADRAAPVRPSRDRPDDLDRDDHHEVGDRHGGEESRAPRSSALRRRDRPGPGRLRDDQVRDDAADGQDQDDVDGEREQPQVAAGQVDAALSATS